MAYVDWNYMADLVKGERRLKELLLPKVETAEDHPFLAQKILFATQYANKKLRAAGIQTPLTEPLTDEVLKTNIGGLIVGELSKASSSAEPWEQRLAEAAKLYFDELTADTADIEGAELRSDTEGWPSLLATDPDAPLFDDADPTSAVNRVFRPMDPPWSRRW